MEMGIPERAIFQYTPRLNPNPLATRPHPQYCGQHNKTELIHTKKNYEKYVSY